MLVSSMSASVCMRCVIRVVRWLLLLNLILLVVMVLFLLIIGIMFSCSRWYSVCWVFV